MQAFGSVWSFSLLPAPSFGSHYPMTITAIMDGSRIIAPLAERIFNPSFLVVYCGIDSKRKDQIK